MKLAILGILAAGANAFALQAPSAPNTEPIKVRACLQGNGSAESPWVLRGAVLPAPPSAAPAAPAGGRGGDGGGRGGGAGRGGAGRGGDAAGQPPAAAGRGAQAGGRGGDGGRSAAPTPPAPAAPQPRVDLRLTGVDMMPWRNMPIEVEGTLGTRPASGPQEFKVETARSV